MDDVDRYIEAEVGELVELARTLVRFDTTSVDLSPGSTHRTNDEAALQAFVAEELRRLGADVDQWEPDAAELTELVNAQMPLGTTLGIRTFGGPEEVEATLSWAPELCTSAGVLHGGVLMALRNEPGNLGEIARKAFFEVMNPKAIEDKIPDAPKAANDAVGGSGALPH